MRMIVILIYFCCLCCINCPRLHFLFHYIILLLHSLVSFEQTDLECLSLLIALWLSVSSSVVELGIRYTKHKTRIYFSLEETGNAFSETLTKSLHFLYLLFPLIRRRICVSNLFVSAIINNSRALFSRSL